VTRRALVGPAQLGDTVPSPRRADAPRAWLVGVGRSLRALGARLALAVVGDAVDDAPYDADLEPLGRRRGIGLGDRVDCATPDGLGGGSSFALSSWPVLLGSQS
jgi:hypothetical protein